MWWLTVVGCVLLAAAWLIHRSERRRDRGLLVAFYNAHFDDYLEDYERETAMAQFTEDDTDDETPGHWPRFDGPWRPAPGIHPFPAHAIEQPEQHRVTLGEAQARARRLLKEWRANNGGI